MAEVSFGAGPLGVQGERGVRVGEVGVTLAGQEGGAKVCLCGGLQSGESRHSYDWMPFIIVNSLQVVLD